MGMYADYWDKKLLPDTVKIIEFHPKSKFNYNIDPSNLPAYLEKFTFGCHFNRFIELPKTIRILNFAQNSKFNKEIDFPKTLEELRLGLWFNKKITDLPRLHSLFFTSTSFFNNIISGVPSLKYVEFGNHFNQDIKDILSNGSISEIKFSPYSYFSYNLMYSNTINVIRMGKRYTTLDTDLFPNLVRYS
jgi:hypothetical protein